MALFANWCDCQRNNNGRKRLWKFSERKGGRTAIADELPDLLRSHYDDMDRIAEDIRDLGFVGAAAVLAERLPRTPRARSGELGEIFATELVEEELAFEVLQVVDEPRLMPVLTPVFGSSVFYGDGTLHCDAGFCTGR